MYIKYKILCSESVEGFEYHTETKNCPIGQFFVYQQDG